jgi:formylglycine-generating enzyme required for sulfatase activity
MTGKIFLNYRRADSKGYTFAIFTVLEQHFSKEQIFMDVDTLLPGVDFVQALEEAVEDCDVFLAVIGARWENIKDDQGRRRIDNPEDFVRIEVAHALKRGIPVIPILVDGAQMPSSENLPDDLKGLSRRHAFIIGDRLRSDVQHLINVLEKTFEHQEAERIKQEKKEAKRQELEKAEADRKAKEEAKQKAKVQAAADKKDKEEKERIARQKAEADRQAREKADAVQKYLEQAELKPKTQAAADKKDKEEKERIARQKAEADRQAREKAESVPGVARQPATADVQQENIDTLQSPFTRKRASLLRKVPVWVWVGSVLAFVVMVFGAVGGFKLTPADEPSPTEVVQVLEVLTKTPTPELATRTPNPTTTVTPAPTPAASVTPTPTLGVGSTRVSSKDGMTMVYIPAGVFLMGSDDGDYDESPVHEVYLDAFWIDEHEVTHDQYNKFMKEAEHEDAYYNENGGSRPETYATWSDAHAYCEWAGRHLPTEAEWEKAARGGLDGKKYPWGDEDPVCDDSAENGAQFTDCEHGTVPVKSFSRNGYGAMDMAGNLWEWVSDWYNSGYYENSPAENLQGPASGEYRVLRGGSWYNLADLMRVANRFKLVPVNTSSNIGFRCAASE